jgi:hypothetical protein
MGRVQKIRRRIRRNAKGRIVVQKNVRRSAIKGYRVASKGNVVKRIPATERIQKARLLKRSWKTTRRAKLRRTLGVTGFRKSTRVCVNQLFQAESQQQHLLTYFYKKTLDF